MSVGTEAVDLEELGGWLVGRRWFGAKSRELTGARLLAKVPVESGPPRLCIALVEARFATGAEEIYQLPVVLDGDARVGLEEIPGLGEPGTHAYDALADRRAADGLLALLVAGAEIESAEGRVDFRWLGEPLPAGAGARPISAEQSNSSVVFGENAILKSYRRLEAGVNPELEMLSFLGDRGFRQIPALLGWYEYGGPAIGATLGVVQEFVADGRDGWELTLDGLSDDADSLLGPLRELGATVGAMHNALAADAGDPAVAAADPALDPSDPAAAAGPDFAPGDPVGGPADTAVDPAFVPEGRDAASVALLVADLDGEVARLFADLPAEERLAPIAGRGEELRERLGGLSEIGDAGMAIRIHGDLHLGQLLRSDRGWTILDFEGEPARPLAERRAKHSPLRDVAGLLRSLAYAPAAARLQRGVESPADWEGRARESLLEGYIGAVDPRLLPATRADIDRLLALHELEKVLYELRYELGHRPDWVGIPVAGIVRLLEVGTA